MKKKQEQRSVEGVGQRRVERMAFVKKTQEGMYGEGSAGKSNSSKWNINGIHFLAVSCRNTVEVHGKKNHFAVITVIYIREQHWIDQNVRFQGNNSTLTIIIIHLKGNFWASKLMGKNGLILLWW